MNAKEAFEITKKSLSETAEKQRIKSEERINSGMYQYFFELIKGEAAKGKDILHLHVNTITSELIFRDSINIFAYDFKRLGYELKVLTGANRIEISWRQELTHE